MSDIGCRFGDENTVQLQHEATSDHLRTVFNTWLDLPNTLSDGRVGLLGFNATVVQQSNHILAQTEYTKE